MLMVGSIGQCCSMLAANWGKTAIFLPLDSDPNICDIGRRVKCALWSPERQTGVSWMHTWIVWAVEWVLGMHWALMWHW